MLSVYRAYPNGIPEPGLFLILSSSFRVARLGLLDHRKISTSFFFLKSTAWFALPPSLIKYEIPEIAWVQEKKAWFPSQSNKVRKIWADLASLPDSMAVNDRVQWWKGGSLHHVRCMALQYINHAPYFLWASSIMCSFWIAIHVSPFNLFLWCIHDMM